MSDITTNAPFIAAILLRAATHLLRRPRIRIITMQSPLPQFVYKHNLSFGYEREYKLLGRVVPPDAAGDPARIRLLSSDRGDELTVYGSKDLLDTH